MINYGDNYCINCNMNGHYYYNCKKPSLSSGIIAVRLKSTHIECCENHSSEEESKKELQFLMVKRKHTFGFIDFVRGKYSVNDKKHLLGMINEMTIVEKRKIKTDTFDELWQYLWGINANTGTHDARGKKQSYDNEKKHSENKLNTLKMGVYLEKTNYNLENLINESSTNWSESEWEFPKGRKNISETDIECAFREFREETGINNNNLKLIRNLLPYEETFIGSNYESYKNKYFVCIENSCYNKQNNVVITDSEGNIIKTRMPTSLLKSEREQMFDKNEISDVQWFSYSVCLQKIRPYNKEKTRMLESINNTLNNYEIIE